MKDNSTNDFELKYQKQKAKVAKVKEKNKAVKAKLEKAQEEEKSSLKSHIELLKEVLSSQKAQATEVKELMTQLMDVHNETGSDKKTESIEPIKLSGEAAKTTADFGTVCE